MPKKLHEGGPPMKPSGNQSMSDEAITAYVRAANVRVAASDPSGKHENLRELTGYMDKRKKLGPDKAGPPPKFSTPD